MDPRHNQPGGLADLMSNRPLIVGLLFLGTYFAPFLILIGLPLAYVFQRRPEEEWEQSHFQFLIRTFWIALGLLALASIAALGLAFVMDQTKGSYSGESVGAFALVAYALVVGGLALAYSGVRIIVSLMKSAKRTPIPNPTAWLI